MARLVYAERDRAAPLVNAARCAFENFLAPLVQDTSTLAQREFEQDEPTLGRAALTALAVTASFEATKRWTALWQQLMVANADGYSASVNEADLMCGCSKASTKFNSAWASKVVADTGDHYRLPDASCAYIDPDGHCQSIAGDHRAYLPTSKPNQAFPKNLVRGVVA